MLSSGRFNFLSGVQLYDGVCRGVLSVLALRDRPSIGEDSAGAEV